MPEEKNALDLLSTSLAQKTAFLVGHLDATLNMSRTANTAASFPSKRTCSSTLTFDVNFLGGSMPRLRVVK